MLNGGPYDSSDAENAGRIQSLKWNVLIKYY